MSINKKKKRRQAKADSKEFVQQKIYIEKEVICFDCDCDGG